MSIFGSGSSGILSVSGQPFYRGPALRRTAVAVRDGHVDEAVVVHAAMHCRVERCRVLVLLGRLEEDGAQSWGGGWRRMEETRIELGLFFY